MSFGYGIHFCLGNLLAKLQGKVALEEITKKIPTLRLMSGADINFIENLSFRVPTSVPVEWTK
jgi:cytochrome P450